MAMIFDLNMDAWPFLLRLLVINEESLLAFCCLFQGDLTKLPTVLFIFSVVLYKLEHPGIRLPLPDWLRRGNYRLFAKMAELIAHWMMTNAIISFWHLFYSSLCSHFTTVVAKEVEVPSVWPLGTYWPRTITKREKVMDTYLPTVIGTLITVTMVVPESLEEMLFFKAAMDIFRKHYRPLFLTLGDIPWARDYLFGDDMSVGEDEIRWTEVGAACCLQPHSYYL